MDWALRIRKDVPSWVLKVVLLAAILVISGLQYFGVV